MKHNYKQELGNWRNTMFFGVKEGQPEGCCFRVQAYPNEGGFTIGCNDLHMSGIISEYLKLNGTGMYPTVIETPERAFLHAQSLALHVDYLPFV